MAWARSLTLWLLSLIVESEHFQYGAGGRRERQETHRDRDTDRERRERRRDEEKGREEIREYRKRKGRVV